MKYIKVSQERNAELLIEHDFFKWNKKIKFGIITLIA